MLGVHTYIRACVHVCIYASKNGRAERLHQHVGGLSNKRWVGVNCESVSASERQDVEQMLRETGTRQGRNPHTGVPHKGEEPAEDPPPEGRATQGNTTGEEPTHRGPTQRGGTRRGPTTGGEGDTGVPHRTHRQVNPPRAHPTSRELILG